MRYAIVSDLHANQAAWQTVLTDIADLKADKIICLGDVVGYGPNPVEVLESVYRMVNVTLQGNHDAAVCGRINTATFSPRAAAAVNRHKDQLAASALAWLRQLPLVHVEPAFRCAHGDFSDPSDFRYIVDPKDALPSFQATTEQLLFVGHSHLPGIYVIGASGTPHFVSSCDFELEAGKRYIINPGSVGYPRAGDCRSSYCLYDDATRTVSFRQLPFDSAGYRQTMQGAGLEDDLWVMEKEQQQHLPTLRAPPAFGKSAPGGTCASSKAHPALFPAAAAWLQTVLHHKIAFSGIAAALVLTAGFIAFRAGRSTAAPTLLATTVPPFDLPSTAAYPLAPPDKNLLPPLPTEWEPEGRLEGWRYAFEDRGRQTFSIGLRDGATTLCIHNRGTCKVQLESPLIDLAGTGLTALRLQGQIRKNETFKGTVFYQIISCAPRKEGTPMPVRTESFEVRATRRRATGPAGALNRKVTLPKSATHVRFRIDAVFDGSLEIEQPVLTDETQGASHDQNRRQ